MSYYIDEFEGETSDGISFMVGVIAYPVSVPANLTGTPDARYPDESTEMEFECISIDGIPADDSPYFISDDELLNCISRHTDYE